MRTRLVMTGVAMAAGLLLLSSSWLAANDPAPLSVNDDAGWCWFHKPRAIFVGDRLWVGSVAAGSRSRSRRGNIEVSALEPASGEVERFTLHQNLQLDDHAAPALLQLDDGRVLAVYSRHGSDAKVRYRATGAPGRIDAWTPERSFIVLGAPMGVTYSNLFQLEDEGGRIYDFHRGRHFNPNALVSDDRGQTWRYAGRLLQGPGRPYVVYAGNGRDAIHFIAVEQHPRDFDNGLYHGYVQGGVIRDSFGAEVGRLGQQPAGFDDLTQIFAGRPDAVAWPADAELDADGRVFAVYSVQVDGAGLPKGQGGMDHRYRYAWFDGAVWQDHQVAHAGGRLYPGEDDYTGLICLHPQRPNTVYFSTNADPVSGEPLSSQADGARHYELFKGVTSDGGATWSFTAITHDSNEDQLRPDVPSGGPPGSALIWLRGRLTTYSNYNLTMVAMAPAP